MSFEPINLFSWRIDPRGVVDLLRRSGFGVEVKGPDDDWSEIVVTLKKGGLLRKALTLTLGHDSHYYDGENWSRQLFGMQNWFLSMPESSNRAELMRLIGSFRFALAVPQDDLNIESNDERLTLLYSICQHLDGVLFTPTSFRDAQGRLLYSAYEQFDPAAVMPKLPLLSPSVGISLENVNEEEEYQPPVPQSPERVARRAMALTAVAARATLELDAPQMDAPEVQRKQIVEWVGEVGIGDELEPQEWKVLQRATGKLEQQDSIDAMWRVEGLAVLAWALQLHALPPDDELSDPPRLYESMGLFDAERASETLKRPSLRSEGELAAMRTHLLMFHWRMRDYSIRPEAMDFAAFSQDCWIGSFDISTFRLIDKDLAIGDRPIHEAADDERSRVRSTAMERHLAINWVMGESGIYSETDTGT